MAERHPDMFQPLLERHRALLAEAVGAHDGLVFEIVGDGLCVAFHTARDALDAALDGQRRLQAEPWEPAPVRVRMGLNTGPARPDMEGGRVALTSATRRWPGSSASCPPATAPRSCCRTARRHRSEATCPTASSSLTSASTG